MEDNLKILKAEFLSNDLLDHTQILNLSLDDQTIYYKSLKWRWSPIEDDLKILKVEFLSSHLKWRQPSIEDDLQWKTTSNGRWPPLDVTPNGRRPPIEEDLKILEVEYLSNHLLDYTPIVLRWPNNIVQIMKTISSKRVECDLWVLRGKL